MTRKKIALIVIAIGLVITMGVGLIIFFKSGSGFLSPGGENNHQVERPLVKYSFENLSQRDYQGSEIKLEKIIRQEENYVSWLFSYQSEGKRVTGMANIPANMILNQVQDDALSSNDTFPIIIMLRGYVDDEIYFTGLGTRKAAAVFAENGFVTLAPDFLGFGGSDPPSGDILSARFEKPVTVLNLLTSIERFGKVQSKCYPEFISGSILNHDPGLRQDRAQNDEGCDNPLVQKANPDKIFLWAHSNGGQIALSVLEVLSVDRQIPATLWAPVTRGFPESVVDYIGEMDDQGKKVIDRLFEFEKLYDPKEFSVDTYFDRISAPLQIQQGGEDYLVEQEWTDEFVAKLKSLGKDITYFAYPKADHNLQPDWDTVVARDLEFFRKFLE